jgi:hypothetical protein
VQLAGRHLIGPDGLGVRLVLSDKLGAVIAGEGLLNVHRDHAYEFALYFLEFAFNFPFYL